MDDYIIYVSIIFASFLHWFQNVLDLLSLLLDDLLFICVFWTCHSLARWPILLLVSVMHYWVVFYLEFYPLVHPPLQPSGGGWIVVHSLPRVIRVEQVVFVVIRLGVHALSLLQSLKVVLSPMWWFFLNVWMLPIIFWTSYTRLFICSWNL